MERFTFRTVGGTAVLYLGNSSEWAIISGRNNHEYKISGDAADRLAAYEDTGLEPEEIKKHEAAYNECLTRTYGPFKQKIIQWLQAKQDWRLVVLPCKVGDSVYIPDLDKKIPVKVRVQGISISVSGRTILHFGGYPVECAWGDGCGKDWFFTSEEAEAALAQKGDSE